MCTCCIEKGTYFHYHTIHVIKIKNKSRSSHGSKSVILSFPPSFIGGWKPHECNTQRENISSLHRPKSMNFGYKFTSYMLRIIRNYRANVFDGNTIRHMHHTWQFSILWLLLAVGYIHRLSITFLYPTLRQKCFEQFASPPFAQNSKIIHSSIRLNIRLVSMKKQIQRYLRFQVMFFRITIAYFMLYLTPFTPLTEKLIVMLRGTLERPPFIGPEGKTFR